MLTKLPYPIMLLLAILLTHNSSSQAQTNRGTSFYHQHEDNEICERFNMYETEEGTAKIIDQMLAKIGVFRRNFKVVECQKMQGCQALQDRGVPYILYNRNFLKQFEGLNFSSQKLPQNTNWAALTILAHEIGHIQLNHLKNPVTERFHLQELELDADKFAGFMMCQMGATLAQAQEAMYHPAVKEVVTKYDSHPARSSRLKAIEEGWRSAGCPLLPPTVVKPPKPKPVIPGPDVPIPSRVKEKPKSNNQEHTTTTTGKKKKKGFRLFKNQPNINSNQPNTTNMVLVNNSFYVDRNKVTVNEFSTFVNAKGYETEAEQRGYVMLWLSFLSSSRKVMNLNWRHDKSGNLLNKNHPNNPVIHVTWKDAEAYCKCEGKRTPTEDEWYHIVTRLGMQEKRSDIGINGFRCVLTK